MPLLNVVTQIFKYLQYISTSPTLISCPSSHLNVVFESPALAAGEGVEATGGAAQLPLLPPGHNEVVIGSLKTGLPSSVI